MLRFVREHHVRHAETAEILAFLIRDFCHQSLQQENLVRLAGAFVSLKYILRSLNNMVLFTQWELKKKKTVIK